MHLVCTLLIALHHIKCSGMSCACATQRGSQVVSHQRVSSFPEREREGAVELWVGPGNFRRGLGVLESLGNSWATSGWLLRIHCERSSCEGLDGRNCAIVVAKGSLLQNGFCTNFSDFEAKSCSPKNAPKNGMFSPNFSQNR